MLRSRPRLVLPDLDALGLTKPPVRPKRRPGDQDSENRDTLAVKRHCAFPTPSLIVSTTDMSRARQQDEPPGQPLTEASLAQLNGSLNTHANAPPPSSRASVQGADDDVHSDIDVGDMMAFHAHLQDCPANKLRRPRDRRRQAWARLPRPCFDLSLVAGMRPGRATWCLWMTAVLGAWATSIDFSCRQTRAL